MRKIGDGSRRSKVGWGKGGDWHLFLLDSLKYYNLENGYKLKQIKTLDN